MFVEANVLLPFHTRETIVLVYFMFTWTGTSLELNESYEYKYILCTFIFFVCTFFIERISGDRKQ